MKNKRTSINNYLKRINNQKASEFIGNSVNTLSNSCRCYKLVGITFLWRKKGIQLHLVLKQHYCYVCMLAEDMDGNLKTARLYNCTCLAEKVVSLLFSAN